MWTSHVNIIYENHIQTSHTENSNSHVISVCVTYQNHMWTRPNNMWTLPNNMWTSHIEISNSHVIYKNHHIPKSHVNMPKSHVNIINVNHMPTSHTEITCEHHIWTPYLCSTYYCWILSNSSYLYITLTELYQKLMLWLLVYVYIISKWTHTITYTYITLIRKQETYIKMVSCSSV